MTALPDRPDSFILFVNGTLMRGFALHANLDGAKFIGEASTAPCYRLFSIDDIHPGMYEVSDGGVSVAGELYDVPWEVWQRIEAGEPPNLYRGLVKLSDGTCEWGILFPREAVLPRHRDISGFASWRAYRNGNAGPR
ncbi:allophanate hydrolase-related protein [Methylosarcina fibrata]|uniref:allophanate hydrolase-related protein n=1 Tax=Methylosarcina fibrata TaxID=105972 RepID=UPI0003701E79|nr:gamma-glutamylcyclotransferase [Methylosarcina fibrata]